MRWESIGESHKMKDNIFIKFHIKDMYFKILLLLFMTVVNLFRICKQYSDVDITVIDYLLYSFNSDMNIVFSYSLILLFFLYQYSRQMHERVIDIMKYKSRKQWLFYHYKVLFLFNVGYLAVQVFLYLIQAVFFLDFKSGFSTFMMQKWAFAYETGRSVGSIVGANLGNLFLYLLTISSLFMLIVTLFQSELVGFVLCYGVIILDLVVFRARITALYPVSFMGKIMMGYNNIVENCKINIGYWGFQIYIYTVLNFFAVHHMPLVWEKGNYICEDN